MLISYVGIRVTGLERSVQFYREIFGMKVVRVDPQMDRRRERLLINSVHAEPGAPVDKEVSSKIGETIEQLSEFLEAKEVVYTSRVPTAWRNSLR